MPKPDMNWQGYVYLSMIAIEFFALVTYMAYMLLEDSL